ncbi:MAG: long-chain fatty acid--CoA ligase [Anaerolineae bacterium]|nr:long-chain fatty acid--CoA ligase [Anaerolineae bacterium]
MEKPWLAFYEPEVPRSIDYPREALHEMLERTAEKYPDKTAVKLVLRYLGPVLLGGTMTYRHLLENVNRFAAALHALGVRKGDRVALMLPNLPQFVIAFFGSLKLGAIVVNTNPTYTAREIEHQFADAGCETVVLLSAFYEKLKEVQDHTQVKRVIIADVADYVPAPGSALVKRTLKKHGQMVDVALGNGVYSFAQLLAQHPEAPPRVDIDPDQVALFQYTGGTTGVPKAAMLTHYNLVANTIQVRNWMKTLEEGNERMMGAIPFFHVYGMTVAMLLAVYIGAENIIVPNPRPLDGVMKAIQKERCTVFPGVPTMYIGIINHPQVKDYNLRSVKACISGAAPLPMDVQMKFGEITGGRLVEGYGLTEAAPVTHCNPIYGERKAGSIGLPFPDVDARIFDYEKLTEKPVGEEGELWLKGPQVMKGYWQRPDETAKTITEDGWLRTGDIARRDEDGYFYIVDRLKDIIIASGFNIVPREVEEVLFLHPKVQEAVVAGVPDKYRGETVKAYVVLKPEQTCTAEELKAFCEERLAPYKVPKQVEFRSELPKTQVGKFLRRVLVEEEKKKLEKA